MSGEVERVVAALTDRQRAAILGARYLFSSHGGYPFFAVDYTDPWTVPVAQFLTLTTDRLTPLGLAVRAYLKEQQQ